MTSKKVVNVNSTEKSFQLIIGGLILFLSAVWQPIWAGQVDPMRTEIIDFELPEGWYLGEVAGLELLASGELVMFNRGSHPLLIFSEEGRFIREIGLGLFKVPHGLSIDDEGYIWTTDQQTHQVLKFDKTGKIHLILGRKDSPGEGWFENGYQLNLFTSPSDVAFDEKGNIYVADGQNYRIVKFDVHGNLIDKWGSKGTDAGLFDFPHSLVINNNIIYVTDRQNARIQLFDLDGGFIVQWEGIGYPYELEIFDQETMIFTDARSGEIVKINFDGKVIERFGKWGKKESEFGFPHGLAVDKNGTVYVGELLNWRVQKFH
jgi:peptidylamidoglycolate lyase